MFESDSVVAFFHSLKNFCIVHNYTWLSIAVRVYKLMNCKPHIFWNYYIRVKRLQVICRSLRQKMNFNVLEGWDMARCIVSLSIISKIWLFGRLILLLNLSIQSEYKTDHPSFLIVFIVTICKIQHWNFWINWDFLISQ